MIRSHYVWPSSDVLRILRIKIPSRFHISTVIKSIINLLFQIGSISDVANSQAGVSIYRNRYGYKAWMNMILGKHIEDLTRMVISYEIYETSLRRV